jgi:capsid protein
MEELPAGMQFQQWDPAHPTTAFGEFIKDNKRGQAAALGVSYPSFAQDPGDANFSSMRIGLVDEREGFRMVQRFLRQHIAERLFSEWLFAALSFQRLGKLPLAKIDKFNRPHFIGKSWEWLDPLADAQANAIAEDRGWTSAARIVGSSGADEEEVLEEIEMTAARREALGLVPQSRLAVSQQAKASQQSEKESKVQPLAASLQVGGTQALVMFLQEMGKPETTISEDAALVMLTRVFGLAEEDARKMVRKRGAPPAAKV